MAVVVCRCNLLVQPCGNRDMRQGRRRERAFSKRKVPTRRRLLVSSDEACYDELQNKTIPAVVLPVTAFTDEEAVSSPRLTSARASSPRPPGRPSEANPCKCVNVVHVCYCGRRRACVSKNSHVRDGERHRLRPPSRLHLPHGSVRRTSLGDWLHECTSLVRRISDIRRRRSVARSYLVNVYHIPRLANGRMLCSIKCCRIPGGHVLLLSFCNLLGLSAPTLPLSHGKMPKRLWPCH